MEPFALPAGWGVARLSRPERPNACAPVAPPGGPRTVVRSYDHAGVMLEWRGGDACTAALGMACDLEHLERFAGELAPRVADRPVRAHDWVTTEVITKLLDRPVLVFVREHGVLAAPDAGVHEWPLERYGGAGLARFVLLASADGAHVAAFGLRLAPERAC